jgi:type IV pilus assembly protein PilB
MLISEDKLKELLVEPGHVKENDFDMTKNEAKGKDIDLQKLLVEKGLIRDESLGRIVADEAGYQFIDIKKANIDEITDDMLDYIPEVVAFSQKAIVFEEGGDYLKLATSKPDNYPFIKLLEKKIDKDVEVFYATPFDMDQALKKYEGDLIAKMRRMIAELEKSKVGKEENVVDLVNLIMDYANSNLASDIHIEPLSEVAIVRYRIDGILHKVIEYPKEIHTRVVARLKIMSKLRTDEKEAAQDGRFEFGSGSGGFDVRVSIMPTTEGENVVMRLLMQRGKRFSIDEDGIPTPKS